MTGPDGTSRQPRGTSLGPSSPGGCGVPIRRSQGRWGSLPRVTLVDGRTNIHMARPKKLPEVLGEWVPQPEEKSDRHPACRQHPGF